MVWVIFASALGVISVTGGLFLRRLLREITGLRRQITGIDREMRAQRARMKFLRYLHDYENSTDGTDSSSPDEAAVANGGMEHPPHAGDGPPGPEPVRRKRHLGLYLGGTVAAVATISEAARTAVREHQSQLIGVVAGAAVSAATVTMVAVQPWATDTSDEPPSSAPTAAPPPTSWPPPSMGPPPRPAPGVEPPASPSPSATETEPSPSASFSPSASVPTSPEATGSTVPIVDETPPATAPDPIAPSDGGTADGGDPPDDGRGTPPAASPTPPPAAEPSPGDAPPSAMPADEALSVRVDVKRALGAKAFLIAT